MSIKRMLGICQSNLNMRPWMVKMLCGWMDSLYLFANNLPSYNSFQKSADAELAICWYQMPSILLGLRYKHKLGNVFFDPVMKWHSCPDQSTRSLVSDSEYLRSWISSNWILSIDPFTAFPRHFPQPASWFFNNSGVASTEFFVSISQQLHFQLAGHHNGDSEHPPPPPPLRW